MSIYSDFVIKKNVDNVKDADIIFLGDKHGDREVEENYAKVIDTLFRKGDIVFVEHKGIVPEDKLSDHYQVKFVTSPIIVKEWDTHSFGSYLRDGVKDWIAPALISTVATIFSSRLTGSSYYLDKLAYGAGALFNIASLGYFTVKGSVKSIRPRNQHMFKVLNDNPVNPPNRRFVIAGFAHLAKDKDMTDDNNIVNLAVDSAVYTDLDNFLQGKKYAILIPKKFENDLVDFS